MNPIEQVFSKPKHLLRQAEARSVEAILSATQAVYLQITAQDSRESSMSLMQSLPPLSTRIKGVIGPPIAPFHAVRGPADGRVELHERILIPASPVFHRRWVSSP